MAKPHALIVGAGPGVGLGIARAFGGEGFNISLLSRNPDKLRDEVTSLINEGIATESFAADASDHDSLSKGIAQAIAKCGEVEVLAFNVLAFSQGSPSTIDPAGLTRDFHVNVSAALAAARAVLPAMLERKSGTILFTGGGWALYPSMPLTSMSIDKAALRMLAMMLAEEPKDTGVRAGTVTIMGAVAAGGPFDPTKIGEAFVAAYRQPPESFQVETQFRGA